MKQHEEGNKFDLMKYRLESAKSDLKSAKILIEAEEYRAANNRAYYALIGIGLPLLFFHGFI